MPEKNETQQSPLDVSISSTQHSQHVRKRWLRHILSEIQIDIFAEIELLLLTLCTGIQDAITFPDYHCFASNQTGNTVLLTISLLLPKNHDLFITANIGVSLACFLLGGLAIGQLGHILGSTRRAWLIFSNTLQTLLCFGAFALQLVYGVHLQGTPTLFVIGLLSLSSGMQVVLSRSLCMTEISTAMATAAWVDLLVDKGILAPRNRARNRRVAFLVALVLGCCVGAGIYVRWGSAWALGVSAVGKAGVTGMFLFNKSRCFERREREVEVGDGEGDGDVV